MIFNQYFRAKGRYFQQYIKKYNLKKFGVPLLERNCEVMSQPINEKLVPMEIFFTAPLLEKKETIDQFLKKNKEEKRRAHFNMIRAVEKPFIYDESNLEAVERAWAEIEENYPENFIEEDGFLTPGVFFAAIKV
jgi:hypothetical protein